MASTFLHRNVQVPAYILEGLGIPAGSMEQQEFLGFVARMIDDEATRVLIMRKTDAASRRLSKTFWSRMRGAGYVRRGDPDTVIR